MKGKALGPSGRRSVISRPEGRGEGREQYFYSLNSVLHRIEDLHLNEVLFIIFFLSWIMHLMYLKSSPSKPKVPSFFPLLYSSFIVLHFTFGPMIHFELIFMKRVRSVSRFMLCAGECPVVSIPFVEKATLSPWNCFCFSQRSVNYICVGLLLDSPFCSIALSLLSPILS